MSEPFIAEIRIFAGNFAPRGWAFCNGQLLPISQNTALFSLIGTIYGGDGRTTTALPDMEGRAPMHPGRGAGLTSRAIGQKVGVETVTLTEAQIPSHTHVMRTSSRRARSTAPSATASFTEGGEITYAPSTSTLVNMAEDTLSSVGGGQPHTNLQPYLAINFIIALVGLYPSRS